MRQQQHTVGAFLQTEQRRRAEASRKAAEAAAEATSCIVNLPHAAYATAMISHTILLLPMNVQAIASNPTSHRVSQLSICSVSILA